jgi:hypothetical protein
MEDDAQAFIEELEKRHQAPITWRTYATWYGNDRNTLREFGVFLYRCNDSFFFEDFERTPNMFGFALKPKKKKEPFVKFEGTFCIDQIADTKPVTKKQASRVVQGILTPSQVNGANVFDKIFRQLVEMVTLADGSVHFFELIDRKSFTEQLRS